MTTIPSRTQTQTEAIAHAGLETRNGDTVLVVCPTSPDARAAYDDFVEVLAGPPGRNGLRCICTYGNYQLVNDTTGGRITFAWPGRDNLVGDSVYLLGYRDWPRDLDLGLMGMWMNSRTRVVTVVETAATEAPVPGTAAGPWAAAMNHRMARQLEEQNRVVEVLTDELERFRANNEVPGDSETRGTTDAGAQPVTWEGYAGQGAPGDQHQARNNLLADLGRRIAEVNHANGWYDEDRRFGEDVALLHSEVSELLEAFRDHGTADATQPVHVRCTDPQHHDSTWDHDCSETTKPGKPEGIGSEAADVLIRLLDTCSRHGIDLQAEVDRKLAYNATRGHKHGGKRL